MNKFYLYNFFRPQNHTYLEASWRASSARRTSTSKGSPWRTWWETSTTIASASPQSGFWFHPWKCKTDRRSLGCRRTLPGRIFSLLETLGWVEWTLPGWYASFSERRWFSFPGCCPPDHRFTRSLWSGFPGQECFC